MTDFNKNLKKVKETFTGEDSQEQIKQWELEHKKAEVWVNLGKHPAMNELIEFLNGFVVDMDMELNQQTVITQEDILKRQGLQNKKEIYNWFLELFSGANTKVEAIEKDVKESLQDNA